MASLVERNGRYCVVYSYKDKTGKRRQKWETYKTMQEAKKRKKEIEYRADVGQMVVPHCKTVKDLMEEYITLYGKEAWALSTYSSNVSMINNYIVPIIGGDKLENINTRFIESIISGCSELRLWSIRPPETVVRVCVTGNDPGYP